MYRICISVIRHFQRAGFPSRQLHGPDVYVGAVLVFAYLERRQLRDLVLSFMAMFTAFLFMQKVIFLLAFFAAVVFYQLYVGRISVRDF